MTPMEAIMAVLRDWPGNDDRLDRLARRRGYWHFGPCEDPDALPLPSHIIDDYFARWGQSFMSEPLTRLNNEELSIRLAMHERMLVEFDDKSSLEDHDNVRQLLLDAEGETRRRGIRAGL